MASTLVARRLGGQQIARPAFAEPRDLVAWMGAVQAQDYAGTKWAVALRLAGGPDVAKIERALADGAILRTHAMRWTWQLVAPEDVRWLLSLVAPRLRTRGTARERELGLDAATFRRSEAAIEKALGGAGTHRTRRELAGALEQAGVATSGGRLSHLLGHAELGGLICSGAPHGKQQTHAWLDDRAPARGPAIARDEALARLARRYFVSRGPATLADFTWWSGLAAAEARAGLESVRSELVGEVVGGRTLWRAEAVAGASPPRARGTPAPRAQLLPAFDEYLVAYCDRRDVLDPREITRLNAGGGMLSPCVLLDGAVVGTWRRTLGRGTVAIDVDLFAEPGPTARRAFAAAADRYAAFLGLEGELTLRAARSASGRRRR